MVNKNFKLPEVTVGSFYTTHSSNLQLKLLAGASGLDRFIGEGSVNRVGLALTGFYKFFGASRIQVIGKSEYAYLRSLSPEVRRQRIREIFSQKIPCLIIAWNLKVMKVILEEAENFSVPIFSSPIKTMHLVNQITICLEYDFAPTAMEHGSMVDIQGVGVMVRGSSGIGKSECVLSLVERGYSLVSDDITRFSCIEGRELIGQADSMTRFFMEVRGIGIINIASIFGASSIRLQKRLDLVITLAEWDEVEDVDRIGLEPKYYELLQIKVPHVIIPIRAGRDLAGLVEIAALDQKLKNMGQFSALEFNERLLSRMAEK